MVRRILPLLACLAALALASSCMSSASSDTFRARAYDDPVEKLSIAQVGLPQETVDRIWQTKFPKKPVVSLSFIVFPSRYQRGGIEDDLKLALVKALDDIDFIDRVVPVPSFVTPSPLSFEAIQQLGIRSLCEYSVILRAEQDASFSYALLSKNMYRFSSKLEYLVVDNETTAIIAADVLNTSEDVRIELFSDKEITKAKEAIYKEQADLIRAKAIALFRPAR